LSTLGSSEVAELSVLICYNSAKVGGVMRSFVLSFCHSFVRSVYEQITHEPGNERRPDVEGMGKG